MGWKKRILQRQITRDVAYRYIDQTLKGELDANRTAAKDDQQAPDQSIEADGQAPSAWNGRNTDEFDANSRGRSLYQESHS